MVTSPHLTSPASAWDDPVVIVTPTVQGSIFDWCTLQRMMAVIFGRSGTKKYIIIIKQHHGKGDASTANTSRYWYV